MSVTDDIAKIAEQEERLAFSAFDEATAFSIGSAIRGRALAENMPIVIQIGVWDRLLFFAALPGSSNSNADWVRRKINVVKMFQKSTYRMVLEQNSPDRAFKTGHGLPVTEYVLAGGGFPLVIKGVGAVGAFGVSGLPERQDHGVIVDALCDQLGIERQALALPVKVD
ncbi:heme-degrading domain-containing protein [Mesorhizobium sp. KR9-304]|uniref:heme-degrading domain-containing protein n=1 Tax=Mesorhizobium sp. KR9-304 TaxID=3156614 RepID=UPI0032B49F9C